jgi:cellulose synthase/poly-beta-1,6-N-acetylglucosamine synthase-like glycosyltransferase
MPFKALLEVGFWNTNIVSEDSQIFWQCYLHYDGDWRVEPLFYPVSMDANVAPKFWQTMLNLYKQQRRWAWGVENIPYAFYGFVKNKRIPLRSKIYWSAKKLEAFWSWATNAILIFALGWLPLLLGGKDFNTTLLSYNLPRITRNIMSFTMFGVASSAILSIMLLPPKPKWFRARHYLLYVLQWLLMPLTLIIFGAIPALDAQTRLMLGGRFKLGFWVTPKARKGIKENLARN